MDKNNAVVTSPFLILIKAHPATQAMSASAKPVDLSEGEIRRNPGEPDAQQAAASTYNKPRIDWRGLTIAVENHAGSVRRGRNRHGVTWEVRMRFDYGEIVGTMGVDGDPVDVIVGPNLDAPMVYVVHQRKVNDWENYDEDKCCVGFDSEDDAAQAFLSNYNDPRFLGPITAMPVDEFVAKVRATRDKPDMIKAERHAPIQAPKGGAVSPLNGEFYDGGQFMATQFDMPKSYKKKIKDIVRRTESKNIASLTAKRGMSGEFSVSKRMAGSDRSEVVFSGTEDQAKHFMDELVSEKARAANRAGLQPHPTEVTMIKSTTPLVLFIKAHVGPYLRGGKIVNVAGYQGRSARAHAAPGQTDLFGESHHTEPTRDLIAEHERLVQVLQSPSHEDDKVEAKKQAAELEEMKQEAGAVQSGADIPTNSIIRDAKGKQYRVHYMRWDLIVSHPIVGGKAQVSADTTVRFRLSDDIDPTSTERPGPVYVDKLADGYRMDGAKAVRAEDTQSDGEHDHLLAEIPGAKWRRGKGLISGHYGVDVDGDVVGNYHAKPEDAVSAAKQALAIRSAGAKATEEHAGAVAKLKDRLMSGGDVTDADLNLLGLRPGSSGLQWFIPAAAKVFGITSHSVRPHIKDLIRIGHTDMGVKKEFVDPKKALQAIAAAKSS